MHLASDLRTDCWNGAPVWRDDNVLGFGAASDLPTYQAYFSAADMNARLRQEFGRTALTDDTLHWQFTLDRLGSGRYLLKTTIALSVGARAIAAVAVDGESTIARVVIMTPGASEIVVDAPSPRGRNQQLEVHYWYNAEYRQSAYELTYFRGSGEAAVVQEIAQQSANIPEFWHQPMSVAVFSDGWNGACIDVRNALYTRLFMSEMRLTAQSRR